MSRILIVANWDWVIYNFRLPLAAALVKSGYEVIMVCPKGAYVERIRECGYQVELWPLRRRSTNPVREVVAVSRLRALYVRLKPDVVHHFTLKPSFYGSLAAFTMRSSKPIVINTFTGLGFLFSGRGVAKSLKKCLMPLLRPSLNQKANWTVFQNGADRESFLATRLARPRTSRVIAGSGVDVGYFRAVTRACKCAPVVFTAARLLWDKGIHEVVQAAEILRSRGAKVEFWIAGGMDAGNLAAISPSVITRWEQLGVVRFLGHRDDMKELFAQADIALLASEHEGLPRFLLEAAASSLPLIATDIPGCRCIVRNGVNGTLVPLRSPQAIADAIEALLSDAGRMRRYARASREIAETEYSEKRIVAEYLDLYNAVFSGRDVRPLVGSHL